MSRVNNVWLHTLYHIIVTFQEKCQKHDYLLWQGFPQHVIVRQCLEDWKLRYSLVLIKFFSPPQVIVYFIDVWPCACHFYSYWWVWLCEEKSWSYTTGNINYASESPLILFNKSLINHAYIGFVQQISEPVSVLTLTMLNFWNGIIHLQFLALSIIILGILRWKLEVGKPTV